MTAGNNKEIGTMRKHLGISWEKLSCLWELVLHLGGVRFQNNRVV